MSSPCGDAHEDDYNPCDSYSLTPSITDYPVENGRRYHRYHEGSYLYPNDQVEQERSEIQYEMLRLVNDGRIFFAPLKDPERILDIGTGWGQWVLEMADMFPNTEINGTDLSPVQPTSVPENVHFYVDDANEADWLWPDNHFDYIHTSMLLGSHIHFPTLIRTAWKYLKPGGYLECHDYDCTLRCDDGTLPPADPGARSGHAFHNWLKLSIDCSEKMDRSITFAGKISTRMKEAGYEVIEERITKVPINPWPRDPKFKQIGELNEQNWLEGLAGFSYAPFGSRGLGWTREQIEGLLVEVRKSVQDRSVHAYNLFHVVVARKPETSDQ
ncbi:hypothetical protein VTO42DRAFT_7083 [Malbranchea cinnamomea]